MAGHSKWANIKRHKAKQDAKRGKLYTKIIREVTVAAKMGGADANGNPRLRAALDKAQQANISKDVLDRAIKRGAGGMGDESLEEIRYEGYGPGGIAIMVNCMTNNRNRTVAEVRHAFSKFGGHLGTDGSVAYLFKKQGQLFFDPKNNAEALMEVALDHGADDFMIADDGQIEVVTSPEQFFAVKNALAAKGFVSTEADITMRAMNSLTISDKETAEKIVDLIDALEDLEDVQTVHANVDITADVLNTL